MQAYSGAARPMLRLSADYVLRWAEIWSEEFGSDVESLLIYATVLQGCVRGITESPELNLRYAVDDVPPDSLRAPISLRSVADQLGMPRETVRRKAAFMELEGSLVRIGGRGFIVPAERIAAARFLHLFEAHHRNIKTFYRSLRQHGLITTGGSAQDGPEKVRLTLRLFGEFVIEWCQLAARLFEGHVLLALMFAAIVQANLRDAGPADDGPLDPRPISVHAVAVSLALPPETARRYAGRLEAMGFIARTAEGVVVPTAVLQSPAMLDLARTLGACVTALFRALESYGVVLADEPETATA